MERLNLLSLNHTSKIERFSITQLPLHIFRIFTLDDSTSVTITSIRRPARDIESMAPKRRGHDQGDALSSPNRDVFPFMSLPAEIRIRIYEIATSSCVCVPWTPRSPSKHYLSCSMCRRRHDRYPQAVQFPPHVKALLSVKQIRDDMLPHLHLAWVGGFRGPMTPCWDSFKRSAIPAVEHLTICVEVLFFRHSAKLHRHSRELLSWMRWRSQRASRYGWNLTHLTLIEGSRYWPSNPLRVMDGSHFAFHRATIAASEEVPKDTKALAKDFPMIKGLKSLTLILLGQPGPVLLDGLSKKCEAHGIERFTVTVSEN